MYIVIRERFHILKPSIKYYGYLAPLAKTTLLDSWDYPKEAFAGQTFCKQILDRQPISIFDLLDLRLLELEYLETLFQYIRRKKGNINYISGYVIPELLRLCTRPKPLLIDNVWKV